MSQGKMIQFEGAGNTLGGYLATPGQTPAPGVVVIHENQGLTDHIKTVADRLADAGFAALAVDALSPQGGSPADKDEAIERIKGLSDDEVVATFSAGVDYLRQLSDCTGKVATVGFCWGGRVSGLVASAHDNLSGAVIYYGKSPSADDVKTIQCPLLMHYGADDKNVNPTVPDFEEALKANGKTYTKYVYEGAGHAFNNDTREDRYHGPSAALSWDRTVAFLRDALV